MHNHSLAPIAPLLLGQVPFVDAGALGQWLFCAACAAVLLNYGFTLFRNLTGGFQRKPAAPGEGSPSLQDCVGKHAAIDSRFITLQAEWKKDRADLHNRMNTIAEGVAFIRGKYEESPRRKP